MRELWCSGRIRVAANARRERKHRYSLDKRASRPTRELTRAPDDLRARRPAACGRPQSRTKAVTCRRTEGTSPDRPGEVRSVSPSALPLAAERNTLVSSDACRQYPWRVFFRLRRRSEGAGADRGSLRAGIPAAGGLALNMARLPGAARPRRPSDRTHLRVERANDSAQGDVSAGV